MTQKVVLKVGLHGEKDKKHILKAIAKVEGINEVAVDVEKGTLTVIGNVDAVCMVNRLRKYGRSVEIVTVGPPPKPSEPKKPDEPKPKLDTPPPPYYRPCPPPCPPYPSPSYYDYDYDTSTCSIT